MAGLFHRGLIWKEWRYSRWYFLLLFLSVMVEPVLFPLLVRSFGQESFLAGLSPWAHSVKFIIAKGTSTLEVTAMIAVVLLAALMMAGERNNGLKFLASTPVSREQILMAKWLTGSLAILACMVGVALYMLGVVAVEPAAAAFSQVLTWWGLTSAALLCLFSLALMTAALFNGVLYSALLTPVILILPVWIMALGMDLLKKFGLLAVGSWEQAYRLVNYLFFPAYIMGEGWGVELELMGGGGYLLAIFLLLLASWLLMRLAVYFFTRNPLERPGEMLLCGNSKQWVRIILAFLLAPAPASERSGSLGGFLLYFILFWLVVYVGLGLLWRIMAWMGLYREGEVG